MDKPPLKLCRRTDCRLVPAVLATLLAAAGASAQEREPGAGVSYVHSKDSKGFTVNLGYWF